MSDLVGTQIVGFLRHRLILVYDQYHGNKSRFIKN